MALSSLSKPCESFPPLGRQTPRSRQDDRCIDALFEDGGLVGIDEDSPLELPLSKPPHLCRDEFESSSTNSEERKSLGKGRNEECKSETPLDEESFKEKWREILVNTASPKLDRRDPLDSLLGVSSKTEQAKDDWGENTDILLMLPDGTEANTKTKLERVERRVSIQKKVPSDRVESPFEFGEYQPSCLTGGRKTPIAGRRRTSPTNFNARLINSDASVSDVIKQPEAVKTDADDIFPPRNAASAVEGQTLQRQKLKQRRLPAEPVNVQDSDDGALEKRDKDRDSSDNSLFERLRQALVSKAALESEKNQLKEEMKHLRDENGFLKEELLKAERDKLRGEKEMSEMEISNNSAISKQFLDEKEEAQKLVVQLTSEIHLLKNACILADEKLSSLQRVYQEEVDMLKESHAREMEAKEKQLCSERSFLVNQKQTLETLAQLLSHSNEWSRTVEEIQHSMVAEREQCNKFRRDWLEGLEKSVSQQQSSIGEWCNSMQKQLEEIMRTVSFAAHSINELQTCEKDNLQKEKASLQALQEAVRNERADLACTKLKLEDIRNMCLQEKENFLQKCFEERKELTAERDAVLRMKEQLYHADAALEKQLLEHATRIQNETGELSKQRSELERARIIAAEIAQEVEDGRRELELRYQAFERSTKPCRSEDERSEDGLECKPYRKSGKGKLTRSSSDLATSSKAPLFRLVQQNPWNDTVKHLPRKVKRKKLDAAGREELMANTETLLRLQEQNEFLQEAKNNLQVSKQWSKKFWSGKKIL